MCTTSFITLILPLFTLSIYFPASSRKSRNSTPSTSVKGSLSINLSSSLTLILFSLISLDFTLVPTWKFGENAVSFFSSDSPNYKEIEVINSQGYILKNIYTKNDGGTITVTHKLSINTVTKDVEFSNMQLFKNVSNFGKVICPQGRFFPLDSNGDPITIDIQNSHLDWDL